MRLLSHSGVLFAAQVLSFGLAGCTGKDADPGGSASDTGEDTGEDTGDDDSGTGTDSGEDTGSEPDPNAASLTGKVTWGDGTPASSGVHVRICFEVCIARTPDSAGVYVFDKLDPYTQSLEIVALGQQDDYATPLAPVALVAGEDRELTEVISIPAWEDKEMLSEATEVTLGGKLVVHADPAGLTPNVNSPSTDPYLAGVEVSPEGALPFDGIEGTVVAMWYLGLFEGELDPVWPFTVADTYGLSEGTQLRVYAASYNDFAWLDGGTATVGADAIKTDEGSGIPILTTLILVAD